MTIMNSDVNNLLNADALHEVEKLTGKDYHDFNSDESALSLGLFMELNRKKEQMLQVLGDTHSSMTWEYFMMLLNDHGFKEGLRYDFETPKYDFDDVSKTEEAVLFYHPEKGLIIFATSYGEKTKVNGGKLYGEVSPKHPVHFVDEKSPYSDVVLKNIVISDELTRASNVMTQTRTNHDAFYDLLEHDSISFSNDIREGLFNKLNQIEQEWNFCSVWKRDAFLWFLDYAEEKVEDYDYQKISKEKILRSHEDVQKILTRFI